MPLSGTVGLSEDFHERLSSSFLQRRNIERRRFKTCFIQYSRLASQDDDYGSHYRDVITALLDSLTVLDMILHIVGKKDEKSEKMSKKRNAPADGPLQSQHRSRWGTKDKAQQVLQRALLCLS